MLDRLAKLPLLASIANFVKNEPGNSYVWIEFRKTKNERSNAPHHTDGVHHENNGGPEKLGQRGTRIPAFKIDTVVQPVVAFNQCQFRVCRLAGKSRNNLLLTLCVEMADPKHGRPR